MKTGMVVDRLYGGLKSYSRVLFLGSRLQSLSQVKADDLYGWEHSSSS